MVGRLFNTVPHMQAAPQPFISQYITDRQTNINSFHQPTGPLDRHFIFAQTYGAWLHNQNKVPEKLIKQGLSSSLPEQSEVVKVSQSSRFAPKLEVLSKHKGYS